MTIVSEVNSLGNDSNAHSLQITVVEIGFQQQQYVVIENEVVATVCIELMGETERLVEANIRTVQDTAQS